MDTLKLFEELIEFEELCIHTRDKLNKIIQASSIESHSRLLSMIEFINHRPEIKKHDRFQHYREYEVEEGGEPLVCTVIADVQEQRNACFILKLLFNAGLIPDINERYFTGYFKSTEIVSYSRRGSMEAIIHEHREGDTAFLTTVRNSRLLIAAFLFELGADPFIHPYCIDQTSCPMSYLDSPSWFAHDLFRKIIKKYKGRVRCTCFDCRYGREVKTQPMFKEEFDAYRKDVLAWNTYNKTNINLPEELVLNISYFLLGPENEPWCFSYQF